MRETETGLAATDATIEVILNAIAVFMIVAENKAHALLPAGRTSNTE
jgi:hypothetical protein